jgi:hypothetical protein
MKLAILLSFVTSTYAFEMAPQRLTKPTTLSAASPIGGFRRKDDWSDKPISERKSTKSVPVKKVNKFQRATTKDIVLDPNYFLTWAVGLLGPLILWYHPCKYLKVFFNFHIHNDPTISESYF